MLICLFSLDSYTRAKDVSHYIRINLYPKLTNNLYYNIVMTVDDGRTPGQVEHLSRASLKKKKNQLLSTPSNTNKSQNECARNNRPNTIFSPNNVV